MLDFSFVRELVRTLYARGGRPSVDPVVFFRLQLVVFFEGIRSERELMRVAADRLSVRWYLGYDLHEPLPLHSSPTRARERFRVEVFRHFFKEIVERCAEAGLVWGEDLFFDATQDLQRLVQKLVLGLRLVRPLQDILLRLVQLTQLLQRA